MGLITEVALAKGTLFYKFVDLTNTVNIMYSLAFIGGVGSGELLLILFVFLILFGAKRIPELARGLGKGIREFKNAAKEIEEELEDHPKDRKDS